MPRRVVSITIDAEGRDKAKVYQLTEMSAEAGEAWATRLLLALGKAGVDVPEGIFGMGMAGVAAMGIRVMGQLPWEVARPLLDEMMECVKIQPDHRHPEVIRKLISDDIEEVATRLRLRDELIKLHVGFSVREFVSNLRNMHLAEAEAAANRIVGNGPDTEMSPLPSDA